MSVKWDDRPNLLPGTTLFDDLSGGSTIVNVPTLSNVIPSFIDSIAGGTFTAYGDLSDISNPTVDLAVTQSVNLQIVPHGATAPVFNANVTPGSDSVGPFESLGVSGLANGRYFADWLVTDTHGDTNALSSLFAVQPGGAAGSTGPTGPTGPAGGTGPTGPQEAAGKNGSSSQIKCVFKTTKKTTGKGKHKKTKSTTKEVCTVKRLAPGAHTVSVAISRGRTTYAAGTAAVRGSAASVKLHTLRSLKHGRYLVTVISTAGKKLTVSRFRQAL